MAAVLAFALTGCRETVKLPFRKDPQVSVVKKTPEFIKIRAKAPCDVHYTQGDRLEVRLVGERRAIDAIALSVDKGTLIIGTTGKYKLTHMNADFDCDIYVTSPDLVDVELAGVGDFIASGHIDTDKLTIDLRGVGDLKMADIICDRADISQRGTGDIDINKLQAQVAVVEHTGIGDVEVGLFRVGETRLGLKGVGDIDARFTQCGRVECDLKGVGSVSLEGDVRSLRQSNKGVGDIDTDELRVGR